MTNINTTPIAMAVKAAFHLSIDGQRVKDIVLNATAQVPYEFGIFADQDVRAVTSMYYTLIWQFVSLMYVQDVPLQDAPKEGSLAANDTGRPDEYALQRDEAIKDCLYGIAYLGRHLISLDERARKELEGAGNRTADGGRFRFNLKARVYKSMFKDFEEVLLDIKSKTLATDTRRLAQIDAAMEYSLPLVSETDASQTFMDYMDPMRLVAGSQRAADAVIDQLIELGELVQRNERDMAQLNAERQEASLLRNTADRKVAMDSVTARMVMARNQYRLDSSYPLRLLKHKLGPIALLQHSGGLKVLVDTPEWRAAEAHERAQLARAKAAEAQSAMVEMEAMMAEQEANMGLFRIRQQQLAMQKAMEAQEREFKALLSGGKVAAIKATPAEKAEKAAKAKAEKAKAKAEKAEKAKAEKTKAKAEPVTFNVTTHSTRGAATGFRPRG